ncbi:MFS multidrug transporter [Penicillium psychrosexuale]|uniref:MFS multidrug transporter n=1 Tax=Penicillium psychrosexuale TaxID=1002107 RepID=UPI0025458197|nr:MFS multidrug transporter [Penicillium psychrosexuale]KAJ5796548.1 MFS multidrug transporter [Penicillium psychrosexuale]
MVLSTSDLHTAAPAGPAEAEADGRSANWSPGEHPSKLSQAGSDSGSFSLRDEEKQVAAQVGAVATDPATPLDSNIVDWDGPDDPGNPVNFSGLIKGTNVGIVSALTFITPLASSMFAPSVPQLMEEFNTTNTLLGSFVVTVYVLGFAIGPLILAPASELVGRAIIYHICNLGFTVFTIACAVSTNMGMLIVFRFFQGCFGSAPVTNGGGTIADLIVQEKRGGVIAIYALGPLLGPVIGPVAGGYLAAARGWRWVFWVLTIVGGFCTIACFVFLRETYPTVLLKRKTQRLIKETGNTNLRSKRDNGLSTGQLFLQALTRPFKILFLSPIVFVSSIYVGIVYGYQYLMFSTFTRVFEDQYGWPTKSSGLSFLGIGIGSLLGLFVIGAASDRILKAKSKPTPEAPSGGMKPEYRLPPLVVGAFCIPAGLFMYGWSTYYKKHWIVPLIGTAIMGIGNIAVFMCITSYLVDAFTIYAASALAANTVVRSIMGALLPLAGPAMYDSMGLGWGNSLLGFIAVVCIPVPWVMIRYGERMRLAFDASKL